MDNRKRKRIYYVALFSLLMSVNGCSLRPNKEILDNTNVGGNQTVQIQTSDSVSTADESKDNQTSQGNNADTQDSADANVVPVATKEISIYTINQDTLGVESAVALVPEDVEITPQLIIELVTDSMADKLVEVGIDEVTTKKDTVIVSFKADKPPVTNVGSGLEKTILDAIAQSLVDNLKDYPKIIFRIEGKAYESGHLAYGIDQVYLDNSNAK